MRFTHLLDSILNQGNSKWNYFLYFSSITYKPFPMRILFLVLFSISAVIVACSEAKEDSKEIPSESFRNEVSATEVRTATAERKSFDYLVNATGKLEALSEVKALVEQEGYLYKIQESQLIQKKKS